MRPTLLARFIVLAGILISWVPLARAQGNISTVAGGIPSNVPALSTGFSPSGVFRDPSGQLYISSDSTSSVYMVSTSGQLTTVAGNGTFGFGGDGGPATSAVLSEPTGVFVDVAGNIFIADTDNNRIREVVASTGNIKTVAGNGTSGFNGDGGLAINAELNDPEGVFVDSAGNIFIADTLNNRIREVVASTGDIQTVAGNGLEGFSGDTGLATSASLNIPESIFLDAAGNLYIADTDNNRIREVFASTGDIQTVAGNGSSGFSGDGGTALNAKLNEPENVFVDPSGNIFITDTDNNRIREVIASSGNIQTVAGNGFFGFSGDGGSAASAGMAEPTGAFVDAAGNIYIGDYGNSRIREVVALTGNIQTIAGNGSSNFGGDTGTAIGAELSSPSGIFVDAAGNIYFGDYGNNRIREVVASTGNIRTVAGDGIFGFGGDGGLATAANLNMPGGVFVDSAGDVFIADSGNNRIREVVASTGDIQTVAGNGSAGFSGDGGLATGTELSVPGGVSVDPSGNIFIADTGNNRVREVVASTGNIKTVAGNGSSTFSGDGGAAINAGLNSPTAVFVDAAGNIFIADTNNNRVREVVASTGNIQTVAGDGIPGFSGDGSLAISAQLKAPKSVFVDPGNDIFISDSSNNRIREVVASTHNIQTVAGNGVSGFAGDGGAAAVAELNFPEGVWGDARGNLLISDSSNNRIRSFLAFGAPPICNMSANPNKVQIGQTVTIALVCAAPGNDSLTGTVVWGDGGTASTGTAVASGGSANLSFTHAYAKASGPTDLITATVVDANTSFTGTISPPSVAINVFAAPVVAPSQSSVSGAPGQAVNVSMSFAGGSSEAGAVFSTIICTVSPTAPCVLSPATLTLDSNGNANLSVTVTPPTKALAQQLNGDRLPKGQAIGTAVLLYGIALLLLGMNFYSVQRQGSNYPSLALLFATLLVVVTMNGCGGASSSPPSSSATSVTYTVSVQAQSTATSQLPSLQANGTFKVVVPYP